MPGSWTRLKIWSSGEILTAADLNAEFNNVITNDTPSGADDYMANSSQAQTQTDPYPSAVLSLATSLAGELERYRYQMAQMSGTTYWYEDPPTDLATIAQSQTTGLAVGLEFEGALGGGSSTTDVLAKLINQGAIINASSWSTPDVAVGDFDSTNKKFGNYSYTVGSGNILAFPGYYNNPIKGTISAWVRNLAAGDYIAYNPLTGAELYLDGSGFLTFKQTERTAASESSKNTTTVVGSNSRAGDTTFRHVTAKWRLNDENGAGTDLLELEYGGADEGTQVTADNIDINHGRGGIWFIGAKRNDPTWDHFYAANASPDSHSDVWTRTGTFTVGFSGGILSVVNGASGAQHFSKTNNIDLGGMTIDWKMRVNSISARGALEEDHYQVIVSDDSKNRGVCISYGKNSVSIRNVSSSASAGTNVMEFNIDTASWHQYRLTSVTNGSDIDCAFYIDGVKVVSWTNTLASTIVGDIIAFGGFDGGAYTYNVDFEYFRYESNGSTVFPPVIAGSQGNIDSFGIASSVVSDSVISRLQSSKVSDVFGKLPSYGITLPYNFVPSRDANAHSTASTTFTKAVTMEYFVAGDGVTPVRADGCFAASASAANTVIQMAIDINGDYTSTDSFAYGCAQQLTPVLNNPLPMTPFRSCILPVGLNTVSVKWRVSANIANLEEMASTYELSIPKQVFLP